MIGYLTIVIPDQLTECCHRPAVAVWNFDSTEFSVKCANCYREAGVTLEPLAQQLRSFYGS